MLNFLSNLTNEYEIYVKPLLNGEEPDFLIIRPNHGVVLIVVNEMDLTKFKIDDQKKGNKVEFNDWIIAKPNSPNEFIKIKSPLAQISTYKSNIINFHIPDLIFEGKKNRKFYAIISTLVYFHNATNNLIFSYTGINNNNYILSDRNSENPFQEYNILADRKNQYQFILTREDLTFDNFDKLLIKSHILDVKPSVFFDKYIYIKFAQQLRTSLHEKHDEEIYIDPEILKLKYNAQQIDIIKGEKHQNSKHDNDKTFNLFSANSDEQNVLISNKETNINESDSKNSIERNKAIVKGVYGSGKTTVLAACVVVNYLKLRKIKSIPKILILTFNITLVEWIKYKIEEAIQVLPQNFPELKDDIEKYRTEIFQNIVINNYHQFIKQITNHLGISISDYYEDNVNEDNINEDNKNNQFNNTNRSVRNTNYLKLYDDYEFFNKQVNNLSIKPEMYDAVFIDEIQDYKRDWMMIIKNIFLSKEGKYYLFGDEKQNIYDRQIENKDMVLYFGDRIFSKFKLMDTYRSETKITNFIVNFQKKFFSEKYNIDNINTLKSKDNIFKNYTLFEKVDNTRISYIRISNENKFLIRQELFNIISNHIIKTSNPRNSTAITYAIIGTKTYRLRTMDAYYRYITGNETQTTFEKFEHVFLTWLDISFNCLANNEKRNYTQINDLYMDCCPLNYNDSIDNTYNVDPFTEQSLKFASIIKSIFKKYFNNADMMIPLLSILLTIDAMERNSIIIFENCIQNISNNLNLDNNKLLSCLDELKNFLVSNAGIYKEIVNNIFSSKNKYDEIRTNQKRHFSITGRSDRLTRIITSNYDSYDTELKHIRNNIVVNLSTIHSFKGMEADIVFLLIDKEERNKDNFAELLYTGITRTKEELIIIDMGNTEFSDKIIDILNIKD